MFLKNKVVLVVVAGWGGSLLLAERETAELENDRPADGNGHVEVDAWHDGTLRAVDRVAPYAERDRDDVDMVRASDVYLRLWWALTVTAWEGRKDVKC